MHLFNQSAQQQLPYGASSAERRQDLARALAAVGADLYLSRLMERLLDQFERDLPEPRPWVVMSQGQIAADPWWLCCSPAKARRVLDAAEAAGLIRVAQRIDSRTGERFASGYAIHWPGVRAAMLGQRAVASRLVVDPREDLERLDPSAPTEPRYATTEQGYAPTEHTPATTDSTSRPTEPTPAPTERTRTMGAPLGNGDRSARPTIEFERSTTSTIGSVEWKPAGPRDAAFWLSVRPTAGFIFRWLYGAYDERPEADPECPYVQSRRASEEEWTQCLRIAAFAREQDAEAALRAACRTTRAKKSRSLPVNHLKAVLASNLGIPRDELYAYLDPIRVPPRKRTAETAGST